MFLAPLSSELTGLFYVCSRLSPKSFYANTKDTKNVRKSTFKIPQGQFSAFKSLSTKGLKCGSRSEGQKGHGQFYLVLGFAFGKCTFLGVKRLS